MLPPDPDLDPATNPAPAPTGLVDTPILTHVVAPPVERRHGWPFVFEGALVGLLGAAISLGVLMGISEPLSHFMVGFLKILPISVGSISRDVTMLVMGAGTGLGVVGAWVSVRTYLIR